jgi:4-hydroxy-tetrahydrodipicolinate synthase
MGRRFRGHSLSFFENEAIDEEGLHSYIAELSQVKDLKGLVPNGHTGEIMSLRPHERARVTQIVAETIRESGSSQKVVSGISAEDGLEAIGHALEAQAAGADGILLMPPHHWLRFGRTSNTAVGF